MNWLTGLTDVKSVLNVRIELNWSGWNFWISWISPALSLAPSDVNDSVMHTRRPTWSNVMHTIGVEYTVLAIILPSYPWGSSQRTSEAAAADVVSVTQFWTWDRKDLRTKCYLIKYNSWPAKLLEFIFEEQECPQNVISNHPTVDGIRLKQNLENQH